MKKLGLLVFFLGAVLFVNAQSVGLADPMITAPLNAIENSVVGIKDGDAGFRFIESGGLEIPAQSAPGVANVTISVNFQRIKLTSDDVTSISGTLLNYFSANYNVANNILTFTQNAMIPADGFGDILFPISVIQNSTQAETLNGFEAIMSVSDPGINITGNRVARRTFTKTSLFAIDDPINVVDEDSNNNNIAVIGNDSFGTDGPSTTIPMTITIAPTNGTAFVNEGGTPNNPSDDFIVYTPNTNYNGTDTIEYEICDLSGFCDKATVTIMVNPILDVEDDEATTMEEVSLEIDIFENDNDLPTVGTLEVTQPTNGTVTVTDPNGTPNNPSDDVVTYLPNANYNNSLLVPENPDTFTYTLCDAAGNCDTATVRVTVTPTLDINPDSETTPEDVAVVVDVFDNDSDIPTQGTIEIEDLPTNGTVVITDPNNTPLDPSDDVVTYTPNEDYNGPDTFTYTVCDTSMAIPNCGTAEVTVTVIPVNDLPLALNELENLLEDSGVTNIDVLENDDFGGDGPSSSPIIITTPPTNGTAVVNDNNTPNNPTDDSVDYTPNPNYNGGDSFSYQICDSNSDCSIALVTIDVISVNDVPMALNDPTITVSENSQNNSIPVLVNDNFGGDGPSTSAITIETPPNFGTAVVNDNNSPNDPTDDTVEYTPNTDYVGPDTLIYQICDVDEDCVRATVEITVAPIVDLQDDPLIVTEEDEPIVVDVYTNDTDIPTDGTIEASDPLNGTVVISDPENTPTDPSDDVVTYTPDEDYNGPDTFTYTVCDTAGNCDTATVTVEVTPTVDVEDDAETTDEEVAVEVDVFVNDNDLPLIGTIEATNPTNGTVAITDPNNTPNNPTDDVVTYTPNDDFNGEDTFTYTVCDAATPQNCDTATVTVTINPIVDVEDDAKTTVEDTPVIVDVYTNDNDIPTNGTIEATVPSNGTVAITDPLVTPNDPSDDVVTYTPNTGYLGEDTFEYTVCDAVGNCDTALVTITINPIAVLQPDVVNIPGVDPAVINVYENDSDIPTEGTIEVSTPTNGTVVVTDPEGTPTDPSDDVVTYTPNPDYFGEDTFTYTVCDAATPANCATETITVNVEDIDLGVTIEVDNAQPTAGDVINFTVGITNNEPIDGLQATDVTVDLSEEITTLYTFLAISTPDNILYDELTGILTVGDLDPTITKTVEISVRVIGANENTVTATIGALSQDKEDDTIEANNANNTDSEVISPSELPIPEGFTPNGDGINDVFEIANLQIAYPNYEMKIVNRYGNIVYKYKHNGTTATPIWWNGTSYGRWDLGSDILPTGTYFYVIDFKQANKDPKTGWVYLRK